MGGPLLTCAVSGPVPLVCIWEGEGRRCVIGVCLEMKKKKKKIHLYLRMPTVAGHKLLWCGGSLLLPQSCILVFTDRILPCPPPPRWFKFTAVLSQPLKSWHYQECQLPPDFGSALTSSIDFYSVQIWVTVLRSPCCC